MDDGEVILGDGSYVFTLEKRGYVKALQIQASLDFKY